jgi:hypothetical protein
VPKVKKGPTVTGARRTTTKSVRKSSKAKRPVSKKAPPRRPQPVASEFQVRELDPQAKCGAETSVQFLHRVIERSEGRITNHLVFFDQHGWYCEHGRACPAVGHAKKHIGWTARDSE